MSKPVHGSTACIAGMTDRNRCARGRSTSALAWSPGDRAPLGAERVHHARRHRVVHEVDRQLPVSVRRYTRLMFQNRGPVASSLPARLLR
jgi:hypothetical protein